MRSVTISQFLLEEKRRISPDEAEEFLLLMNDIVLSVKKISVAINKGALLGTMGSLESENVQNETQKQLDVISNEIFLQANEWGGHIAGMVSEEMDHPYDIPPKYRRGGKYLLLFDPLDGSSNVNINVTVGTIFSVLHRPGGTHQPVVDDFLQPGTAQVCAGYALYGSSTMIVLTMGHGVFGFTLDHEVGEFYLTHRDMMITPDTAEFAVNMSNERYWEEPVRRYVTECVQGDSGPRKKNFNMRWIASLVAEVHRVLIRGGVFMYPVDERNRAKGGRLRLMYEANPISFIVEQAGGLSVTGHERIMEVNPTSLHQRVSVILGARNEVQRLLDYHRESKQA